MKRIFFIFVVIAVLTGCRHNAAPVTRTDFVLDTVSSISVYDMPEKEAAEIIGGAFELCRKYEGMFSKTIKTSEVYRLNSSGGQWVEVSNETAELIDIALEYARLSGGKFDITIAPASELWDFKAESPSVPEPEKLAEAMKHVGYENIEENNGKFRLLDAEAAIDLGGVAKGYIADRLKEFLIENGVKKAIVSLGGNVVLIGPEEGETFSVGIQKPFGQAGELMAKVDARDMSVVTSGIYQRYFKKDGVVYHHILDAETGMPAGAELLSVTIISPSSAKADALSTACFAMGVSSGMELVESQDAEAVFILSDYSVVYSSGINSKVNFELLNPD